MDTSAKGGLTQFWKHLAAIPCTPKDVKRQRGIPGSVQVGL